MRFFVASTLLAAAAFAAPAPLPEAISAGTPASNGQQALTSSAAGQTYTAAIVSASHSEPPPLWDPPIARPPPLFEAPKEDLPELPWYLLSVHRAPVQSVRPEKLSAFTGSSQQPVDNIYKASDEDPESNFLGEGSLRPAARTAVQWIVDFVSSWIWWISVVVLACVLVYVAEKMLIGAVIGARRARSASRVARSRAASLVAGTRSRAASLVRGGNGRGRAGTMSLWTEKVKLERSRSPPIRPRSSDGSMV